MILELLSFIQQRKKGFENDYDPVLRRLLVLLSGRSRCLISCVVNHPALRASISLGSNNARGFGFGRYGFFANSSAICLIILSLTVRNPNRRPYLEIGFSHHLSYHKKTSDQCVQRLILDLSQAMHPNDR